ncbi:MAG: S-layer homology domain-containing protein [Oscillospiraceae bacterium]|nr:S-layer homology domain-containing protein [Oscillospiraceae bacterium]
MKRMIALLLTLLLCQQALAATLPDVTQEMSTPDYWIAQCAQPDRIFATAAEIKKINADTLAAPETNLYDLAALPEWFDGVAAQQALADAVVDELCYSDGQLVPASYFAAIRRNILGAATSRNQQLEYALCTRGTALRLYPVGDILTDDLNDPEFDLAQVSSMQVGEPMVISAWTADKKWAAVTVNTYRGWASADDFAICTSRSQWLSYQTQRAGEDVLVVTGDRFTLEQNLLSPQLSGLTLDMGTVLPLAEPVQTLDGRMTYHNELVTVPTRDAKGNCVLQTAMIPQSRDVQRGYLPLTQRNLLTQMFKMLGNRYGWGGMLAARDCSQLTQMVYRCFGLQLPRDTAQQAAMPVTVIPLSGYDDAEKARVIASLPTGAMLYFPGHIMFYLGADGGRQYVLSAVSVLALPGEAAVSRPRTVVVNTLDVLRANQKTWLSEMSCAIVMQQPSFSDLAGIAEESDILRLAARGVVTGDGSGCFHPEDALTRREFATMLSRLLQLKRSAEPAFSDVTIGAEEIGAVCAAGVMLGTGDGRFLPDAAVTARQAATVLARIAPDAQLPDMQALSEPLTRAQAAALLVQAGL